MLHLMSVQAILLSLTIYGTMMVTEREHHPAPYMDEVFHIPQAQKYCNGSFHEVNPIPLAWKLLHYENPDELYFASSQWDPKITTLPGLYLFSIGIIRPLIWATDGVVEDLCSVLNLRLVNSIFCAGNLFLLYSIVRILRRRDVEVCSI